MISTITDATAATAANPALSGPLALVGILVLFGLLLQKESCTAAKSERLSALGRVVDIAVCPLLAAFILVAITRVAEVLK